MCKFHTNTVSIVTYFDIFFDSELTNAVDDLLNSAMSPNTQAQVDCFGIGKQLVSVNLFFCAPLSSKS